MTARVLVVATLALHYALHLAFKIRPASLVGFLLLLGLLTLCGRQLLRGKEDLVPDRIAFYGLAFLSGLGVFLLFGILLYHRVIRDALHLRPLGAISAIALVLLLGISLWARRQRKRPHPPSSSWNPVACWITILVASLVTHMAYSGFANPRHTLNAEEYAAMRASSAWDDGLATLYSADEGGARYTLDDELAIEQGVLGDRTHPLFVSAVQAQREAGVITRFGNQLDKWIHLGSLTHELAHRGLPPQESPYPTHRGLQVLLLLSAAAPFPLHTAPQILDLVVDFIKLYVFVACFLTGYLAYVTARRVFSLPDAVARWAPVAQLMLSPVVFPFFGITWSSYRGIYKGPIQIYHNDTQMMSMPFAFSALFALYLALKHGRFSYRLAAFLMTVSFFVKPSFFAVGAPALFAVALLEGDWWRRTKIHAYLILLAAPAYQLVSRPVVTTTEGAALGDTMNLTVQPFAIILTKTADLFPDWLAAPPLRVLAVAAMGFAFVLPAFLWTLPRTWRLARQILSSVQQHRLSAERLAGLAMLASLTLGLLAYSLLVEENVRRMQGNFGWPSGAGIMLALPLLLALMWRVDRPVIRWAGVTCLTLQLLNGFLYLTLEIAGLG